MVDVRKIDLRKDSIGVVSPLQADILKGLWKQEKSTVRELYNTIKNKKKVALTSIAVDLDRLHKKGMVERVTENGLGGPHYIYSVSKSKSEFEKSVLDTTVNKLIEKFGSVAVDYFNDRFSSKNRKR
ncbi:MAG TPA: BlaI/MecI/CopY family transcriptional regulator [archaeon]|nr:BlaI/MecI/CopY family transcriptional regulator [archaeon]